MQTNLVDLVEAAHLRAFNWKQIENYCRLISVPNFYSGSKRGDSIARSDQYTTSFASNSAKLCHSKAIHSLINAGAKQKLMPHLDPFKCVPLHF